MTLDISPSEDTSQCRRARYFALLFIFFLFTILHGSNIVISLCYLFCHHLANDQKNIITFSS